MTAEAKKTEVNISSQHSNDRANQSIPEIKLLRAAYTAFNARDISAALKLMNEDVTWPKAFKGGFVKGPDEIRKYWTEQWSEINPQVEPAAFYPQNDSQILVDVHQVVRSLDGSVLADEHVGHLFTIKNGLIQAMEISSLP
ncbi:MAG: nuclear transport factor 2 family protein [Cellvibrio sp.]